MQAWREASSSLRSGKRDRLSAERAKEVIDRLTGRAEDIVMDIAKLTQTEIREQLKNLKEWSLNEGKLYKEYKFRDFVTAFAFMTKVADAAEALNHHPEWFNVYDIVKISLTTHDVDGISQNDFFMARKIDELAQQ